MVRQRYTAITWLSEWRNFQKVIIKAKTSCEATGNEVLDHFVGVNKMVKLGSGSERTD